MNKIIPLFVGLFLFQTSLSALECTAKIANRTFSVKLTEKMGVPFLEVQNDTGTYYQGFPTKYYSSTYKVDTYHLPVSTRRVPIELEIDKMQNDAATFCLEVNVCSHCR